jgi:hypothetical protein
VVLLHLEHMDTDIHMADTMVLARIIILDIVILVQYMMLGVVLLGMEVVDEKVSSRNHIYALNF